VPKFMGVVVAYFIGIFGTFAVAGLLAAFSI
jgi:hypothetical protein